jgi:hypothetical protein
MQHFLDLNNAYFLLYRERNFKKLPQFYTYPKISLKSRHFFPFWGCLYRFISFFIGGVHFSIGVIFAQKWLKSFLNVNNYTLIIIELNDKCTGYAH